MTGLCRIPPNYRYGPVGVGPNAIEGIDCTISQGMLWICLFAEKGNNTVCPYH